MSIGNYETCTATSNHANYMSEYEAWNEFF